MVETDSKSFRLDQDGFLVWLKSRSCPRVTRLQSGEVELYNLKYSHVQSNFILELENMRFD